MALTRWLKRTLFVVAPNGRGQLNAVFGGRPDSMSPAASSAEDRTASATRTSFARIDPAAAAELRRLAAERNKKLCMSTTPAPERLGHACALSKSLSTKKTIENAQTMQTLSLGNAYALRKSLSKKTNVMKTQAMRTFSLRRMVPNRRRLLRRVLGKN
mmetsp:Transcript_35423/g.100670  ORF Transcript_35423/g.100670 Transcript_35423/m.100670 type:complete len:158 (+) Transcript_35423:245-718(+)